MLDIFTEVREKNPEITLKIVGDGPLREELRRRISERGLEHVVNLAGEVDNDIMPDIYNESSLFVLPTIREGVPRTVLEAMACGLPVVTTNLPQVEPVVEDCGLAVPRDTESFSEAINNLLASPDRQSAMNERCRIKIRENYSWQDTVRKTTNKYCEILNNYHHKELRP